MDLDYWIKTTDKIDMNTYHKMIDTYDKKTVDNALLLRIFLIKYQQKDFYKEQCMKKEFYKEQLKIWNKYGYFLATLDNNPFYEEVVEKISKNNKNTSNKSTFSIEEEVYYGFHLLKKDYINILLNKNTYIELDLNKIFSSINSQKELDYIIDKFTKFYNICNRESYFDKEFKQILNTLKNNKNISINKLNFKNESSKEVLSFNQLQEQIDMYIKYSIAFTKYQEKNTLLIYEFINRYFPENQEDYFSVGVLGITRAIKTFDIRRCLKFSNYAWRGIKNTTFRYFYKNYSNFSAPVYFVTLQEKLKKISKEYLKETGKDIPEQKLKEYINVVNELIRDMLLDLNSLDCSYLSNVIYKTDTYGVDITLQDSIRDKNIDIEAKSIFNYDFALLLNEIDKYLTTREKDILLKRAGYQEENPMTLDKISKIYGISKEAVRKIEKKAIDKLKVKTRVRELNPYE